MNKKNRTDKSINNAATGVFFFTVTAILYFFSRKVFIDYLGADFLGLNATLSSLLHFLNLAELGIGAAISYLLYKPIAENNQKEIHQIITIQKLFYRKVVAIIIVAALVAMLFFPVVFSNTSINLCYIYLAFSIFLFSTISDYLFNYKQIVFTASQQDYKLVFIVKSIELGKIGAQLAVLYFATYKYTLWLACEFASTCVRIILINRLVKKNYAWLSDVLPAKKIPQDLRAKLVKKIKQVFFHKIGGFVATQSSPLLIYMFTTLTTVAIYGNYMVIVTGTTMLVSALFLGINGGVGNLVTLSEQDNIFSVFQELFAFQFFVVCCATAGIFLFTNDVIKLWFGADYVLSTKTVLLITIIFYLTNARIVVDSFIVAKGLYDDIYSPIVEIGISLITSIVLGRFLGLDGVLFGGLLSLLCVIFLWKPYFLFKYGLKIQVSNYVITYIANLAGLLMTIFIVATLFDFFNYSLDANSFTQLFKNVVIVMSVFSFILWIFLCLVTNGMRRFTMRIYGLIKTRLI